MDLALDLNYKDAYQQYTRFLENDEMPDSPNERLNKMISKGERRLIVDLNLLRELYSVRCAVFLSNAQEELLIFKKALREVVSTIDADYAFKKDEFLLGFEGSFGARHVSPRTLKSTYIGNIVCCEGIVTKTSLVQPKVVRSVHYCPKTNKTLEQKYTDMTSLEGIPTSCVYPTKDADGNPLETEFGLCTFKDYQTFTIQEMPEKAPAGQLPRSVDVIVEHDLVDVCKPGDRVQVVGMFRCLPSKKANFIGGSFRTILIANNIQLLNNEMSPNFSVDDVQTIKNFAKSQKGLISLLAKSLAPSICGHNYIKKAILCQLVGGTEKILENGTRLRGDINLLMVGDPSTAKSQLLRYVLHAAPRAIPTTGRGTTGVGLTAAVTSDGESGERRLEAGAMVLADRGIVCIDEFDKMSDIDRTAIHEVMEQGRVTICKAGIHARLNARCSVLAAANPVYGRYDEYKTPMENISMQDSLLSRFDLLFIVLDQTNADSDYIISEHVLKMHHFRAPNEADGEVMPFGDNIEFLSTKNLETVDNQDKHLQVFEKENAKLYSTMGKKQKYVTIEFLNKYIHLAKQMRPELSDEAISIIVEAYTNLRKQSNDNEQTQLAKTMPVTARTFETLIRLSTAHAKLRLSTTVDKVDAKSAVDLVYFSFFHKVEKKIRKRHKPAVDIDSDDDGDDQEVQIVFEIGAEKEAEKHSKDVTVEVISDSEKGAIDSGKMKAFRSILLELFTATNSQVIELADVQAAVASEKSGLTLNEEQVIAYLKSMEDENKIMLVEDSVYLI